MRVLVTGLCGFIGHHLADVVLNETDWDLVALDRIDATSTPMRLRHVKDWNRHHSRVSFVWHDLRAPINGSVERAIGQVDGVVHLAAQTHVDRSIEDPLQFVQDNVLGTAHLLDWWRKVAAQRFLVHVSTDEVFGSAPEGVYYREFDRYNSSNPYSASKAGAEELAVAFSNTYNLKIAVIRWMNIFGERQHPEKFVPMTVRNVLEGRRVHVHSDPVTKQSGSRFYLHAENAARAAIWLVQQESSWKKFDKWNVVGEQEISNLDMARSIAAILDRPLHCELIPFPPNRPGHDARYALDGSKLARAGFTYPMTLDESLTRTVQWFAENREWLGA